jgi:hypothetical protein
LGTIKLKRPIRPWWERSLRLLKELIFPRPSAFWTNIHDERRRILDIILESTLADAETIYRQIYETNAPLMRFLRDSGTPVPKALCAAVEVVLNADLRRAIENEESSPEHIDALLDGLGPEGISLDEETLEYALRGNLERLGEQLSRDPAELAVLQKLEAGDLWKVQNFFYDLLQTVYAEFKTKADQGDKRAQQWVNCFTALGEKLSVRIE